MIARHFTPLDKCLFYIRWRICTSSSVQGDRGLEVVWMDYGSQGGQCSSTAWQTTKEAATDCEAVHLRNNEPPHVRLLNAVETYYPLKPRQLMSCIIIATLVTVLNRVHRHGLNVLHCIHAFCAGLCFPETAWNGGNQLALGSAHDSA